MNHKDKGLIEEQSIVLALNGKKYAELNNNLKYLIKQLFPLCTDESLIECDDYDDVFKADIKIVCDGQIKNVSVKTGKAEVVHNEILDKFLKAMKSYGISDETIETLKLFHYGDDTLDGTGIRRMDHNEVMVRYAERIKDANYEINGNRRLVKDFVNRCIFAGASEEYLEADAIYVGDVNYGVVATKNQVMKHVDLKYYSYYKAPHIGPLIIRPDARYVDSPVRDIRKRNRIVASWVKLQNEIAYIANRYTD